MKLSEERMGQIALKALIQKMASENAMPNVESLRRGLPDEAKKLGISTDEAKAFMMEILPKTIATRLGCAQVSLVWTGEEFR